MRTIEGDVRDPVVRHDVRGHLPAGDLLGDRRCLVQVKQADDQRYLRAELHGQEEE
jgi:hypothetical protein